MPTIYRVVEVSDEQNDFVGFYQSSIKNYMREYAGDVYFKHSNKNPSPCEDEKLDLIWRRLVHDLISEKYYFGFSSKEQFHRWFAADSEFLEKLRDACAETGSSLSVLIIETDDYFVGDAQVIYRKSTSKEVDLIDFWEFLTIKE